MATRMRKTLLFSGLGTLVSFVSATFASILAALLLPPNPINQAVLVLPLFIIGAASMTGWIAGRLNLTSKGRTENGARTIWIGSAFINLAAALTGVFLIYSGIATPTEAFGLFAMLLAGSLGHFKVLCLTE